MASNCPGINHGLSRMRRGKVDYPRIIRLEISAFGQSKRWIAMSPGARALLKSRSNN